MREPRVYADFPSISGRNILGMEPHRPYAWDMDTCLLWGFEGIREGNTRQLIPLAFEPWLLGQFFVTALPGSIRRVEHALQRMTGYAELFAMVSQQIMKGFLAVIDAIFGILFDLANGPIPDTCQLKKPGVELQFLRGIETKLELPLDHLIPTFDFRCIV